MRGGNALFKNRRPPPISKGPKRNPEAVSQVIDMAFRRFGISQEINKYKFVLHWEEIVGADLAKRSKPEYLKGQTLVVRAQDSTWSQELSFHKRTIISRLNRFLGKDEVKDMLLIVG